MRVRADQRVRVNQSLSVAFGAENHARQPFQVDLMNDSCIGRDDLEFAESLLAPVKEGIAFAIALELQFVVAGQCVGTGVVIDLDRVVHHQFGRRQGIDRLRIASQ